MPSEPRPLHTYASFGRWLGQMVADDIFLDPASGDMRALFEAHPKLLIAWNHGPPLGPLGGIASFLALVDQFEIGERVHFGITWRGFYKTPLLSLLAQYLTQTDDVYDVPGYAELLRDGPYTDLMIAPEGDHSLFGDGLEVQPFLSPRFVEIAVRAGVPILAAYHQGTEHWAEAVPVESGLRQTLGALLPGHFGERILSAGKLSLPLPMGRLPIVRIGFGLYHPTTRLEELEGDRDEVRARLMEDAEGVRRIMQEGVTRLKAYETGGETEEEPSDDATD